MRQMPFYGRISHLLEIFPARNLLLLEEIVAAGESKDCMAIAVSPHLFTLFENNDFFTKSVEVGNSRLYIRYSNLE